MTKASDTERRNTVDGHVHDFCWLVRQANMSDDYSYNKSQRDALFLKFLFDKELYLFPTELVYIIWILNTIRSNRYLSC